MKTISKSQQKQNHWRNIKEEFLKNVPSTYKVDLVDIDRESDYFHPTIDLGGGYKFTSQCDTRNGLPYAQRVCKEISTGGYVKELYIDIEKTKDFFDNKFDNIDIAKKYIDRIEMLELLKTTINETINDLRYYAYFKEINGIKLRKTEREVKNKLESLLIEIDNKL